MPSDLDALNLSKAHLETVRDSLCEQIRLGLRERGRDIKALPAFLGIPAPHLTGRSVALDVGGTHMRAAWIEFDHGTAKLLGPIQENALMERATRGEISGDEFFSVQADLICASCREMELNVGYCFSYPATITPQREAVLIEWTKGIHITGTVSQPVGRLLAEELARRGRKVHNIPVLNDTVASLLTAAAISPHSAHHIGVIVGTGTNMAGFFPVLTITKLGATERGSWHDNDVMAVNLETGNFTPSQILTPWDDALDTGLRPEQRGRQRFEKAVSGAYLPRLLWQVAGGDACLEAGFNINDPLVDAGKVAALRNDPILGAAATAILNRSADLIAAGLAGLICAYRSDGEEIGVLVEGSLFHKTSGYPERVRERLNDLTPHVKTRFIVPNEASVPVNLLGAASAALS